MLRHRTRGLLAGLCLLAAWALAAWALAGGVSPLQAQDGFPTRPIKLVVPFGAGGITDVVARLVAQGLSDRLGQPVVVVNRPGAGGATAAQSVATAAPDGYTLLLGTVGTQVVNKMIYPRLSYDPASFVPISLVSNSPYVIAVSPALDVNSLKALVERAKAEPGKLNFGSAGNGSSPHLALELLELLTGTKIEHIPFKSGGDAVNGALSGQIQIVCDAIPVVMPHQASGRLKALAITDTKRSAAFPDLPTTAEQGVEGMVVSSWNALLAPAGTPDSRVTVLRDALAQVLADPTLLARFQELGIEPMPVGSQAYARHIAAETERWSKVVEAAHISIQ